MLLFVLYDWGGLNRELFSAINGFRGPVVDGLALTGTRLGDVTNAAWVMLALLLFAFTHRVFPGSTAARWFPREQIACEALFIFTVGCALTTLLVFAGKTSFDMPRPYKVLPAGSVNVLARPIEPYSLPSGHAALAMLVASVFWPYCKSRPRALLASCVLWVGISRISVGAHFPADVLAGYVCGGMSGWYARALTRWLRKRFAHRRRALDSDANHDKPH